jgi:hypothetical protein
MLSFFAPRDFFDNVGKTSPVTKFNIELPREYLDYSSIPSDQSPPYTPQPVDPQIFADIQTAVLRQYGSVARQYLGSFRQGGALSELAVVNRVAALDNGVGMRYSSQFGREIIGINVSAEAVRKLLGKTEDAGYMLVIFNSGGVNKVAGIPMKDLDTLGKKSYQSKTIGWGRGASQYYGTAQLKAAKDLHVAATYISIAKDGTVSDTDRLNYYKVNDTILGPAVTSPSNAAYTSRPLINFTGRVFYDNLGNRADFSQRTPTCTVERSWIIDADAVAAVDKSGVLWGYSQAYVTGGIHINYRKYYFADAHWDAINSLYVGPNGLSGGTAGPDQSNDFTIGNPTSSAVTIPLNQRVMVYSNNGSVDNVSLSVSSGSYTLDQTVNDLSNSNYLGLSSTSNYIYPAGYTKTGPQYLYFGGSYEIGTSAGNAVAWSTTNYPDGSLGPDLVYSPPATYEELYPEVGTYIFAANGKTSIRVIDATTLYFDNRNIVIKDKTDVTDALFSAIGAATTDWVHAIFLDVKKSDIDKLK